MDKQTQSLRILKLLESYGGNWCSLSELMDLRIASITRRISDLRLKGYDIRNKKETQPDGTIYSWYRLVPQTKISLKVENISLTISGEV